MKSERPIHLDVISFAHGHIHAYLEAIKRIPEAEVVDRLTTSWVVQGRLPPR